LDEESLSGCGGLSIPDPAFSPGSGRATKWTKLIVACCYALMCTCDLYEYVGGGVVYGRPKVNGCFVLVMFRRASYTIRSSSKRVR
jgi:hypothetical protein